MRVYKASRQTAGKERGKKMKVRDVTLSGTTDGAGAATVTGTEAIHGKILCYALDASLLGATADTTISIVDIGPAGIDETVAVHTNYNSAEVHYPRHGTIDAAGAAITGEYTEMYAHGFPKIVVASGALTVAFSVTLFYHPVE